MHNLSHFHWKRSVATMIEVGPTFLQHIFNDSHTAHNSCTCSNYIRSLSDEMNANWICVNNKMLLHKCQFAFIVPSKGIFVLKYIIDLYKSNGCCCQRFKFNFISSFRCLIWLMRIIFIVVKPKNASRLKKDWCQIECDIKVVTMCVRLRIIILLRTRFFIANE